MADLNYKFTGVNSAQLANEVQHLRENSSTFRDLEAAAVAAGYKTIEIRMGAGVLRNNIADSIRTDPTTRTIRINSDVTGSWGVGGRQVTVGEVIAHELAHAVVPQKFSESGVYDFTERGVEGMWVRRQAGQVARELGLPGESNADHPITRITVNEIQGCTRQRPQGDGARDGVLFLDGSRGYHGIGASVPPGSGAQDPIDPRRLGTDEIEQNGLPTDFDGASGGRPKRCLGRRIAGKSEASAFDTGTAVVPLGRSDENFLPGRPAPFDDRFGDWTSSPPVTASRGPYQPAPQAGRPRGIVSGEPMPDYPFPPPIFDFPNSSAARGEDSEDWLTRLLRGVGTY